MNPKTPYVLFHRPTGRYIACVGSSLTLSDDLAKAPYFTAENRRDEFHRNFEASARRIWLKNVAHLPVTVESGFARRFPSA